MKNSKFDIQVEIKNTIKKYNISNIWNKKIQEDLRNYKKHDDSEINKREDLRNLDFVTIDGEDARDFDDAVYCKKLEKNWKLYVAIADVAHYVKKNSPIDREAYKRGTSTYFPSYVVPMLPEVLSNDL